MPCKYKGKQRRAYYVTGGWKRKTRKVATKIVAEKRQLLKKIKSMPKFETYRLDMKILRRMTVRQLKNMLKALR